MKRSLLLPLLSSLGGCATSLHQVHMGDVIPYERTGRERIIFADAEHRTTLGFGERHTYVEEAWVDLQAQCIGDLVMVTAETSTTLGFFGWTNRIQLHGLCVPPPKAEPETTEVKEGDAEEEEDLLTLDPEPDVPLEPAPSKPDEAHEDVDEEEENLDDLDLWGQSPHLQKRDN